jgi:hypothetical protein
MADRQPIPGSSAANPEFRGSVRAEDGGQVFVYNGGLDFDETGEFVVSRGPNVVLEVIDASAMVRPGLRVFRRGGRTRRRPRRAASCRREASRRTAARPSRAPPRRLSG